MATAVADQPAVTSPQMQPVSAASPAAVVWSALAAVAAAWFAAGSTGLLARPLQHALTASLLVGSVVCGYGPGPWTRRRLAAWAAVAAVLTVMVASASAVINILACACVPAALALERKPQEQSPLLEACRSIGLFGLYRFALGSVPWFWSMADHAGSFLAAVAGALGPNPFSAGTTFAGLDFLVLNGALFGCRLARETSSRRRAGWKWGLILVATHGFYLVSAAGYLRWIAWLVPAPAAPAEGTAASGHGAAGLEATLLWNLPLLGAGMHLVVAAGLLLAIRRAPWNPAPQGSPSPRGRWGQAWSGKTVWVGAVGLALLIPALALLNIRPLSLQGKTIVVHEKGFLNWLKPKHGDYGRLSVGMYGMLPEFLQSYGARCIISPDLSETGLKGADLVVLIYPNKSWEPGQRERLWRFVRQGGALLVLGEHTVREPDGGSRFNEVLEPTAMRVAFDSAMFAIGGWLHSYEVMAHPAAIGLADDRNQFGVVIGASVEARWPARPLLVGRWGWADPGDASNNEARGSSMMGNQRYDAGEKVGDVLLAAEQRLGKGRVVVFGDTSGFTNGILYGSHPYAAALFASLCQGITFGPVRGLAALLGLLVFGWSLWRLDHRLVPVVVMAFALSLAATTAWGRRAANVTPSGASRTPNNLAYIDSTHLERSSGESWRINGLGGLELTLMRNNYLVMSLPEFTSERLERAGLLISTAPARPFSRAERARLRQFIEKGGIFICMVGVPESGASRAMLADFGFYVGGRGFVEGVGPEPKPFGHFKAPFYNAGSYMNYVRFHAAWPVESSDPQAVPLAYGPRDPHLPASQKDPAVILMRRIGRGKMIVVADSDFASNQNLEREGGQPFEGMRENAHFWQWLLTYVNELPPWTPPKPEPESSAAAPTAPLAPTNAPPPLLQRLPEESVP